METIDYLNSIHLYFPPIGFYLAFFFAFTYYIARDNNSDKTGRLLSAEALRIADIFIPLVMATSAITIILYGILIILAEAPITLEWIKMLSWKNFVLWIEMLSWSSILSWSKLGIHVLLFLHTVIFLFIFLVGCGFANDILKNLSRVNYEKSD